MKNRTRGFTLIELLVVIAIIGILSSVVLASLNSARQKSRDARVVSDVKQVQLALELAFDADGHYPGGTEATSDYLALAPDYIAAVPTHPVSGRTYHYQGLTANTGGACANAATTCLYYHFGASLENVDHVALGSDRDAMTTDLTGTTVLGLTAAECTGALVAEALDTCYDVTP